MTDSNPIIAAQNLDDKRVIKMILESAQMLCTALRLNNAVHLAKYKSTHLNHPSNVWVRTTDKNYEWLLTHFEALCAEYTYRYGKVHASSSMINDLRQGQKFIPNGDLTPFANCAANSQIGVDCKWMSDPVMAYKFYIMQRWATDKIQARWFKRQFPNFLNVTIKITQTIRNLGIT